MLRCSLIQALKPGAKCDIVKGDDQDLHFTTNKFDSKKTHSIKVNDEEGFLSQLQPLNALATFEDKSAAEYLLNEVDLLVIGSPMYNFTVSALLKNYMDHVAIAKTTFQYKYTTKALEGLLKNRYLVLGARGGFYDDAETASKESIPLMEPYDIKLIDYFFGRYLGAKKIGHLVAEGLNVKDDAGNPLNTPEA
ncbi:unnamed protein product [Didymodactylos carnosus]|uniref:Flavodoxin-like fold domain-containing protein n=1 Tax=Didymodactylos carnosus TaxID=1234261 RepID=A0A8S2DFC8_9BILA|nr:unnamed protein product [Didymodactylos carnosus]CAF3703041.1 unnamed protein product [Didymodactylos carnosus]